VSVADVVAVFTNILDLFARVLVILGAAAIRSDTEASP
jgi:hypothetical protein